MAGATPTRGQRPQIRGKTRAATLGETKGGIK